MDWLAYHGIHTKCNYLLCIIIPGTGTIDGKFDSGYFVTVKLGSEVLSGVLYHPIQQPLAGPSNPVSPAPQPVNAIVPYTRISRHLLGSKRRRRRRRRGDPNYPKPNRSGYNFYFAEKHYKLKSLYPNREREFTKMIGESWSNLTAEERLVTKFPLCSIRFATSLSIPYPFQDGGLCSHHFHFTLFLFLRQICHICCHLCL